MVAASSFETTPRRLGSTIWSKKVAQLPDRGVLLIATDLQGNLRDYQAMKKILQAELEKGEAYLVFCGDMVHGPSPELDAPGAWPPYLGTQYADRSAELILDFETYTKTAPAFSLLGNHEHAHVGGPVVSKFHLDEAAVLEKSLGDRLERALAFMRSFPLVAVAAAGVVMTHGAPSSSEPDRASFEKLEYSGYESLSIQDMYRHDTIGALLWSRGASAESARTLLRCLLPERDGGGVVVYGHDVCREGYDPSGSEQLCLSTSYGLDDANKRYLRIDLAGNYRSVSDLRPGIEILPLY